jgi:glycosyltransferase involved in cell wall biosynthesis
VRHAPTTRDLARQLGIAHRAVFAGALDQHNVARAYQRCSLMVLPTHFDSFPLVLLEAMASGRTALSTGVGGIPNLVRDGIDTTLISAGNVLALTMRCCACWPSQHCCGRWARRPEPGSSGT